MIAKINTYFEDNYDSLYLLASARVMQYQRDYDGAVLVNNCYLYLVKKAKHIPKEEDIEIWARKYISSQAYWTNSETNKEELEIHRTKIEFQPRYAEEEDNLEEQIALEKWLHNRKALLQLFRERLKSEDRIKLILLDRIIEEGTTSSRHIAGYYNIPHLTVWKWFKEIKRDLRKFERNLSKYDKRKS
jgi:hypothetical protein